MADTGLRAGADGLASSQLSARHVQLLSVPAGRLYLRQAFEVSHSLTTETGEGAGGLLEIFAVCYHGTVRLPYFGDTALGYELCRDSSLYLFLVKLF